MPEDSSVNGRARLAGKVAIITGSTKGIGRVMARRFAEEGARVIVSGRSIDIGRGVVDEIRGFGGEADFIKCDVSIEADVRTLIEQGHARWGRLDILVNNGAPTDFIGAGGEAPVHEMATENWEYLIRGCLTGPFWACKFALPFLFEAGGGSIINISSMAAKVGMHGMPAYSSAKAGVDSLTRQIAVEYGARGIRCNSLVLGFILSGDVAHMLLENPATAQGIKNMSLLRMGRSEDVANAAIYLSSDEGAFITGLNMPVDGGVLVRTGVDLSPGYGDMEVAHAGVAPDLG